ncbi:MAG: NRDE family protein [Myxococcota bacterium]
MCLLIVLHKVHPEAPLLIAANRDELLARPAVAMTVLQQKGPRILGGRDEVAGGTWLATNEHGVVAGLTNLPSVNGRDPSRRSRGELPLALAQHETAARAVEVFAREHRPRDYNPCWILVGDATSLFYVDMTNGDTPQVRELASGIHVLENRPLEVDSPKVEQVQALLGGVMPRRGDELVSALTAVVASHIIPERILREPHPVYPSEAAAPCVHAGMYGTRSSSVIRVLPGAKPRLWSADGTPCTAPMREVSALWSGDDVA